MPDIAYTGVFHFVGALIAAWGAWRSWQNYKITNSQYYALFFRIGLGVAISMGLYSIYTFPEFRAREFLQFAWLVGVPIMYWAFVHAVHFTFKAIQRERLGLFYVIFLIIAMSLLMIASLVWPPQSYVAEGIVVWNPQYPMNIIHPALMTLAMLPMTILFLSRSDYTPRTFKSF